MTAPGILFSALRPGHSFSTELSGSADGVAILADALRTYPGSSFLVSRAGATALGSLDAIRQLGSLKERGNWPAIERAALAVLQSGRASVECFPSVAGEAATEASFLPLADGENVLVLLRPQSYSQAVITALSESRTRYKAMVEAVADFCWETDSAGRFRFISETAALGWPTQELIGRPIGEFLADDGGIEMLSLLRPQDPVERGELWFRCADGRVEGFATAVTPILDGEGRWQGCRGLCMRITDQREAQRRAAQGRFRARLQEHLTRMSQHEADPERAIGAVLSGLALAVCASGALLFRGATLEQLHETARWGEMPPGDSEPLVVALFESGGTGRVVGVDGTLLAAPLRMRDQTNGIVVLWRTDLPFSADELELVDAAGEPLASAIARLLRFRQAMQVSLTDPLTGLLNRRGFVAEVDRRMQRLRRSGTRGWLMFADLNNFKLVNDSSGHARGDVVLTEIATVLRENVRTGDCVARIGGDEFVIWIEGLDAAATLERAHAIAARCGTLGDLSGDPERRFGISIGIVGYDPKAAESLEELLVRADMAMYHAKRNRAADCVLVADSPA